ncbi:4'-phosphopantetheinyl transferase family protein [Streptomyces yangpuensis]|uniref:4'-phosphopantetheinyl transferase family protein n=1 Tax=Streptomyces yangpuensis TaxID=1648182 RepID=UPI0037F64889
MVQVTSTLTQATYFDFGALPASPALPTRSDGAPALWIVGARTWQENHAALASRVLDAEEHRRAAGFRHSRDRRCYVAAHVALRLLVAERLHTAPEAVRWIREPCPTCGDGHGRPAVAGGGAHFSLSHSGDLALIGIADAPLGVDVERLAAPAVVADVVAMLHPRETAEVAAEPDDARPMAFARAWARKEAYLKGIGTGLSRSPALDYVGAGPLPASGPDGWTLGDVAVPQGYAAAFALRSHG